MEIRQNSSSLRCFSVRAQGRCRYRRRYSLLRPVLSAPIRLFLHCTRKIEHTFTSLVVRYTWCRTSKQEETVIFHRQRQRTRLYRESNLLFCPLSLRVAMNIVAPSCVHIKIRLAAHRRTMKYHSRRPPFCPRQRVDSGPILSDTRDAADVIGPARHKSQPMTRFRRKVGTRDRLQPLSSSSWRIPAFFLLQSRSCRPLDRFHHL